MRHSALAVLGGVEFVLPGKAVTLDLMAAKAGRRGK